MFTVKSFLLLYYNVTANNKTLFQNFHEILIISTVNKGNNNFVCFVKQNRALHFKHELVISSFKVILSMNLEVINLLKQEMRLATLRLPLVMLQLK